MKRASAGADAAQQKGLSRRSLLRGTAIAAACAALPTATARLSPAERPRDAEAEMRPQGALKFLLEALRRYSLVAVGDRHGLQEIHDVLTALLFHPDLPRELTDVVVEFGNARHQGVADRFVLEGRPVADADLQRVWRHTIGGGVLWDAPAYGQFFRTVRAVNWTRPPARRLRVLLGDPPFDHGRVRGAADKDYVLGLVR
jgi:hypothetical protein